MMESIGEPPPGDLFGEGPAMMEVVSVGIVIVDERIDPVLLKQLVDRFFEDTVESVVDVRREVIAVGGDLHADAKAMLLGDGSRQEDLWGANYYPGRGREDCVEPTSLINIRPAAGNRSMELLDPELLARVRELTFRLLGNGETLP